MTQVDPDTVWGEAGPLIAAALQDSDDTAEEVLQCCRLGTACLLADERGFCVLTRIPQNEGFDLLIWVAVSKGPTDCLQTFLPQFEDMARYVGARRLAFRTTPRRAYERLMPSDWSIRQVLWAKEM